MSIESVGFSMSFKDGEFDIAMLSIMSMSEKFWGEKCLGDIVKEWGCISAFVWDASIEEIKGSTSKFRALCWGSVCSPSALVLFLPSSF